MKRYIRLVNGKIIDTEKMQDHLFNIPDDTWRTHDEEIYRQIVNSKELQVAEANNVFDLIQVGDLVRCFCHRITEVWKFDRYLCVEDGDGVCGCFSDWIEVVSQIYTKQGDNYLLVWDKERGVI